MLEKASIRKNRPAAQDRGAGPNRAQPHAHRLDVLVEGLTQNEIADKLGIGRVTVVRNINEAIRQREVKIWIEGDVAECFELEAALKQAFGFKDAVVVPEPTLPEHITKSVGIAAGMYVSDVLTDHMSIGVGWGATLYESLQTFAPRELETFSHLPARWDRPGPQVQTRRNSPGSLLASSAPTASCSRPGRRGFAGNPRKP